MTNRLVLALMLLGGLALAADPTGSLSVARYTHSAVRMTDGRVLVAGGHTVSGSLSSMTRSTELYDPVTGVFSTTGLLNTARAEQASVLLPNGRVLVVGGISPGGVELSSAETYDPAMGVWTMTSPMTFARRAPSAVVLLDGRVLVVGANGSTVTCELFDPATNTFTQTGSMSMGRYKPALARLNDGRVLIAGGFVAQTSTYTASTELFDPATGTWSAGPNLSAGRNNATATTLADGRVLIAGGAGSTVLNRGDLYSPTSNTFSMTPPMVAGRTSHVATLLADGNVMVAGGTNASWIIDATIEVFDVTLGTWRPAGVLSSARNQHSATSLGNGKVLIAGGSPVTSSANLFDPVCASPAVFSPSSLSFGADAITATLNVSKTANCPWSVTSAPSWISVTSGSGVGNGTITFNVASNRGSTSSRSGLLRVSDASASLSQASDPCLTGVTFLSPSSASFSSVATSSSISVVPPSGCAWSVTNVPSWISIVSGAPGSGSGTVTYSVAANPGSARSATMRIGTANFTVNQSASPCLGFIAPVSLTIHSGGGASSFSVTIGAGCSWNVTGVPSWMTLTSPGSGVGNGTVSFFIAANSGVERSATMPVAGKTFTVTQLTGAGSSCNPIASLASGDGYGGALSSTDCTGGARGSGYFTDRYSFTGTPGQQVAFRLTSSAFDTYLSLRNPSGTVIASNDDGGGGTNSRIPATSGVFTLPAGSSGTYIIEVTSYSAGATGAYTLQRLQ